MKVQFIECDDSYKVITETTMTNIPRVGEFVLFSDNNDYFDIDESSLESYMLVTQVVYDIKKDSKMVFIWVTNDLMIEK